MKGILTVSFGVADKQSGEKSIGMIEKDIHEHFGGYGFYSAYTSPTVRRKLNEKYGMSIMSAEEALDKIYSDGISEVYIVPTNIINGIEYNKLTALAEKNRTRFKSVDIGKPIIENRDDCEALVPVLREIIGFDEGHEYILMGHGTDHEADERYSELNKAFAENGMANVRIATVEGELLIDNVIKNVDMKKPVIIQPLMIVAGDHAKNDMAGNEDSFYTKVTEAGGKAECVIKGLGEYEAFRKYLIKRTEGMIK